MPQRLRTLLGRCAIGSLLAGLMVGAVPVRAAGPDGPADVPSELLELTRSIAVPSPTAAESKKPERKRTVELVQFEGTSPPEVLPEPSFAPAPPSPGPFVPERQSDTPARRATAAESFLAKQQEPIELVEFRELPLGEAMRTFSEQTGLNIVSSAEAGKTTVSLYLRDVTPLAALEALCKANNLWYRQDSKTGIIRIYTTDEYQRDLSTFREEQIEVFTLLYPNPIDVAMAIRDVFGDRVVLSLGVETFDEEYDDLQQRFDRFDLIDERSGGFGLFGGGIGVTSGYGGGYGGSYGGGYGSSSYGSSSGGYGSSGRGGRGSSGGSSYRQQDFLRGTRTRRAEADETKRTIPIREQFEDLTPEEIEALEAAASQGAEAEQMTLVRELLRRRQATIYVTVVRRQNQVVVRTSDEQMMEQIAQLIHRLDVPTPLVLLEVKVMSVELGDDFNSVFDYQFSDGLSVAGGFTSGNILPPLSDEPLNIAQEGTVGGTSGVEGLGLTRLQSTIEPSGTGLSNDSLIFQVVSDNFRFRMQLLESKNRVTSMATPLLLTANNEVSQIFIGQTEPVTIGFTSPQIVTSGTTQTNVTGTPQTTLQDVGQLLLITPNINADRTVTLRIAQQQSRKVSGGATIPVVDSNGNVTNVEVDTIARNTASGTIVAKDGLTVALGGLIEEGADDSRDEVPIIGKLPVVGFFFRRQSTGRTRRETIILVRPYVFNTPCETAAFSEDLVRELSVHPNAYNGRNTLGTHCPWEAARPVPPSNPCENTFRFHSVEPKRY